jgi:hypothetical protein
LIDPLRNDVWAFANGKRTWRAPGITGVFITAALSRIRSRGR